MKAESCRRSVVASNCAEYWNCVETDQSVGVRQCRLRVDGDVWELWNWSTNAVETQLHVPLKHTLDITITSL